MEADELNLLSTSLTAGKKMVGKKMMSGRMMASREATKKPKKIMKSQRNVNVRRFQTLGTSALKTLTYDNFNLLVLAV